MPGKSLSERFSEAFRSLLPAPFTIAICLTIIAFAAAWAFTRPVDPEKFYFLELADYWYEGLWNNSLLVFAVQMMLMLVLGHVLALTKPIDKLIDWFTTRWCSDTPSAAFTVTLLTVCVALFNWGLGLIFGAIFARKVGEFAARRNAPLNYPLIGAAGYSGLMVWHGGFSGSSLSKVAEPGHLQEMVAGISNQSLLNSLPDTIPYSETVFGGMNIAISLALILILPLGMRWLARKSSVEKVALSKSSMEETAVFLPRRGAEILDYSKIFGISTGALVIAYACYSAMAHPATGQLGFINPNWINVMLLGLCLTLHQNFQSFLAGVEDAIGGASGILIQFPLYFGIMGIMKSSGLVTLMSDFFVGISNSTTYPLFTFLSAGIVNIFVPSGGGQWAVQGPIIIQAAHELNVPLTKSILAMAYGDQLTNMLQPFWALPLLGITGLKAKEILPYTLFLMLMGVVIFVFGILVF